MAKKPLSTVPYCIKFYSKLDANAGGLEVSRLYLQMAWRMFIDFSFSLSLSLSPSLSLCTRYVLTKVHNVTHQLTPALHKLSNILRELLYFAHNFVGHKAHETSAPWNYTLFN